MLTLRAFALKLLLLVPLTGLGLLTHYSPNVPVYILLIGVFTLALWATGRLLGGKGLSGYGLRYQGRKSLGLYALGMVAAMAAVGISFGLQWATGRYSTVAFRPMDTGALLLLVGNCMYTGYWEEALYRGYLVNTYPSRRRSLGLYAYIAVVFVLFHVVVQWPNANVNFYAYWAISAIGFTIPFLYTKGLWLSMGAHAGNNIVFLLLFTKDGIVEASKAPGYPFPDFVVLIVSALCLLALCALATVVARRLFPAARENQESGPAAAQEEEKKMEETPA